MSKCNHKWVAMEDGTNDKFCVKCRKFAMQAVATLPGQPTLEATINSVSGQVPSNMTSIPAPTLDELMKEPAMNELINEINKGLSKKKSRLSRSIGRY